MAENYVVNGDDLTSIADAIRTKTGETEWMSVEEMPAKIMSLSNDEDINNAVSAHNTDENAHPGIVKPLIITGELDGGVVVNTSATIEEATAAYAAGIPVFLRFEAGGAELMLRLAFAVGSDVACFYGNGDIGQVLFVVQAFGGADGWDFDEISVAPNDHTHSEYMPKSGGKFTGTVKAGSSYQAPGTALLRNSKLVSTDTTPTVNGEINWTYG